MGNCCSDDRGGRLAVSGASASQNNQSDAPMATFNYFLNSSGYNGLSSQIQLALSASSLQDPDVISKRDPMAVVYTQKRDGTLEELGRTEVLLNTLNPVWITKHNITYHFEFVQTLVFRLFDVDTHCQNVGVKIIKLEEQHFLGEATCALSEIVTKSSRSLTLPLVQEEKSTRSTCSSYFGQLTVQAEECFSSKTMIELIFRCSDLENKDLFSRSDTFLVISKTLGNGISSLICKTEVRKNDLEPTWESVYLNIQQVGSKDSPLDLECYNFNNSGKHVLIGKLHKSLAQLEKLFSSKQGENLFLPTTVGHSYHNKELKSKLFVDKFSESVQHTFLDYLAAGCELNFMVAIDFTASNGNPRLPDSLHYIDPSGRPNAYQRAIFEVGEVLQFYDSDERFPAWGFGARPIDGPVSHCFNLNGSSSYCEVEGIQGILMAYASALFNVSLAGPTLFGQVISTAAEIASQSLSNGQQKYFVFLIITDGVITDLHETKDAIVNASDLPLSIFIVGVGGADFKEMDIFHAVKGERLESTTGRVASRNIVQFVALRDVQNGDVSVQSLLADLPAQFLTYMRTRDTRLNS